MLPPRPASHLLGRAEVRRRARRDVLGVAVLVHLDDGRVGGAGAAVEAALLPERTAVVPKLKIAGICFISAREGYETFCGVLLQGKQDCVGQARRQIFEQGWLFFLRFPTRLFFGLGKRRDTISRRLSLLSTLYLNPH